MPARVANVCPISGGGGITEAFFNSLAMLKQQGVIPIAIVPDDFIYKDRLGAIGVETRYVPFLGRGGSFHLIAQLFGLKRAVRRAKPDILLLNNGRHVAAVRRALPGVPLVAIFHGGRPERFLNADRIIAINEEQVSSLVQLGFPISRTAIVDNALPEKNFLPFRLKHRSVPPVIGTMTLLDPAKGIDVLITAAGLLMEKGVNLKLCIAGTGPEKSNLQKLTRELGLENNVVFVGWVDDQLSFYRRLDLFVLPSHSEEWGLVIVEAQAASLPVIATNTRGPRRIIDDGRTGLLVPVANPHAMATAIEKLIKDSKMAENLARAGHIKCEKKYILSKLAPHFTAEILRVLDSPVTTSASMLQPKTTGR